jgi:hypothetical protein
MINSRQEDGALIEAGRVVPRLFGTMHQLSQGADPHNPADL